MDDVIDVRVVECHASIHVVIGIRVVLCHPLVHNFVFFPFRVQILILLSCCNNSSQLLLVIILHTFCTEEIRHLRYLNMVYRETFFENPDTSSAAPYPQELHQWNSSIEEPLHSSTVEKSGKPNTSSGSEIPVWTASQRFNHLQ